MANSTMDTTTDAPWWGSGSTDPLSHENDTSLPFMTNVTWSTTLMSNATLNTTDLTSTSMTSNLSTPAFSNMTGTTFISDALTTASESSTTTKAMMVSTSENSYISDGLRISAGVFILVFTSLALIGNVGVIIALRHKCYKGRATYTFLNNLAITVTCDCAFNTPFIVGAMFTDDLMSSDTWLYNSFLCTISSFLFNLIHTEIILSLLLLVLDRVFSLKFCVKYIDHFVGVKSNLLAGYSWVHATVFTLPIVITSVGSEYFPFRYLCTVLFDFNLVYNIIFTLFCVTAPWIAIICSYIYVGRLAWELNVRDAELRRDVYDDLEEPTGEGRELQLSKPIGVLLFLWCILIGPYQLTHSIYIYSGTMSIPNVFWTICTCLRFIYDFLVPLVILAAWPVAWKELKRVVTCRRANAIESGLREHLRMPGVRSSWADGSDGSVTDRSTLDRSTISRSFPIPVLYATENGLQLHVSSRSRREGENFDIANSAYEDIPERYAINGIHPPPYEPPLFGATQNSEEDSFNTDSSLPLKAEGGEAIDPNETLDRKSAISHFQLSLGKGDDFKTLKLDSPSAGDSAESPRDLDNLRNVHPTPETTPRLAQTQNDMQRSKVYTVDSPRDKTVKRDQKDEKTSPRQNNPKAVPCEKKESPRDGTKRSSKDSTESSPRGASTKDQIESSPRGASAKDQMKSKYEKDRGRRLTSGPTRTDGGGKEERERKRRHSSGKNSGGDRPDRSRPNTANKPARERRK